MYPYLQGAREFASPELLTAPVVRRLKALLHHARRSFTEREEVRASARGRISGRAGRAHTCPPDAGRRCPVTSPNQRTTPSSWPR